MRMIPLDKETRKYRIDQLSKVKQDNNYSTSIMLIGGVDGRTNCLNISQEEFKAIYELLTEPQE